MGIFVPDLVIDSTGLNVANAYVAVSKNNIYLQPANDVVFDAVTTYNIWNSHDDRQKGKQPLDRSQVRANVNSLELTFSAAYAAIYENIKQKFPGYVDDDDAPPAPLDGSDVA